MFSDKEEAISDTLEGINRFTEIFQIEEENHIEILLTPEYCEEKGAPRVDYYLRDRERDNAPKMEGGTYFNTTSEQFAEETYEQLINKITAEFDEADIIYPSPEEVSERFLHRYPQRM